MKSWKAVAATWLSKTTLSNLNAGEGARNVVEVKTYDGGKKPYVSGQAIRHALREAIERANPGVYKCTVEDPCGKVKECWQCDIFGYLNPRKQIGFDRRWSPLRVSPALGMLERDIVTDLLLRISPKQKTAEDQEKAARRQMLAYIQMVENVYKVGLVLDLQNLGLVKVPVIGGKGAAARWKGWKTKDDIGAVERRKRSQEVLLAISRLSDLAKQARGMASLSPDVVLLSVQPDYSHRIQRAFEFDGTEGLRLDVLDTVIHDLKSAGSTLMVGFTPGVVANDEDLLEVFKKNGIQVDPPVDAIQRATKML